MGDSFHLYVIYCANVLRSSSAYSVAKRWSSSTEYSSPCHPSKCQRYERKDVMISPSCHPSSSTFRLKPSGRLLYRSELGSPFRAVALIRLDSWESISSGTLGSIRKGRLRSVPRLVVFISSIIGKRLTGRRFEYTQRTSTRVDREKNEGQIKHSRNQWNDLRIAQAVILVMRSAKAMRGTSFHAAHRVRPCALRSLPIRRPPTFQIRHFSHRMARCDGVTWTQTVSET